MASDDERTPEERFAIITRMKSARKSSLTKRFKLLEVSNHIPSNERTIRTVDTIKAQLEVVEKDKKILEDNFRDLCNLAVQMDNDVEKAQELEDECEDYLASIRIEIAAAHRIIRSARAPEDDDARVDATDNAARTKVKLPKLNILKFNGNPLDFRAFWQSFSPIHDDNSIAPSDKLRYLIGQLEDAPLKAINGFSQVNRNYGQAVDALKRQFGDENKIVAAHLYTLDDLPQAKENLASISNLRTQIELHLRSLEALDMGCENCDNCSRREALRIKRKLPVDFLNHISTGKADKRKLWLLPEIREAIEEELNRREGDMPLSLPTENQVSYSKKSKFTQDHVRNDQSSNFKAYSKPTSTVGSFQVGVMTCAFCKGAHQSYACKEYASVSQRKERVYMLNLCFKCLRSGHRATECKINVRCYLCKATGHLSVFCLNKSKLTQKDSAPSERKEKVQVTIATVNTMAVGCKKTTALPTARMLIKNEQKTREVRALFDQGSQRSFVKRTALKDFNAKLSKVNLAIDGFNTQGSESTYDVAQIRVVTPKDGDKIVNVIIVDSFAERLNMQGISRVAERLEKKGRNLADKFEKDMDQLEVQMLIGADYYYDFVPQQKIDGITVIPSIFGDLISGPIDHDGNGAQVNVVTALKVATCDKEPKKDVDLLWRLDMIGINEEEAHPDEKMAQQAFNESIHYENGKYMARLPWKASHPKLPMNYRLAQGRLTSGLNKLRKDSKLLQHYHQVMMEQLDRGFIEKVTDDEKESKDTHYLSHHAVTKDSTTTPVRVVFDCSAKVNKESASLNDCLYSGPSMVPELPQILMRFRLGRHAACADIAKAFLMIGLDPRDRDVTRFLWPKDPADPNSPVETYRFKAILFGATCSQFILNATIDHHLKKYEGNGETAEKIRRNIYVDNLLGTADEEHELIEFYNSSKSILGQADLHLREWATNVPKLQEISQHAGDADSKEITPVLGLRWDRSLDAIFLAPRALEEGHPTKRMVLRGLASYFDPLGLMVPVTISGKMLMKDIWETKCDWDDPLPAELAEQWQLLKVEFAKMHEVPVKRNIQMQGKVNIHAFVDASTKAYGVAVYGVCGTVANLLIAKGRVAPKRKLSIPKLELTAATIGARLVKYVKEAYEKELELDQVHIWSDSQVALGWIKACKPLDAFMQNRKNEIHNNVPEARWHYVPTDKNPADLITRGCNVKKLQENHAWWHGPEMIVNERDWEEEVFLQESAATVLVETTAAKEKSFLLKTIEKYSSYDKVKRIMGWIRRFIKIIKRDTNLKKGTSLSVDELNETEEWIIKKIQEETFSEEKEYLKKHVKGQALKCPPLVKQLNIDLQKEKLVCVSRIRTPDTEDNVQCPVLLPSRHIVTKLIIQKCHEEKQHVGINSVVATLRQKWWIPQIRQRVKAVIKDCIKCRKARGKPYEKPPTPPLPDSRTKICRPFAVTGVDYGGPLYVKENGQVEKRYIALFTCATTRAVHLELAQDLSAEAFLRVLRRFASRRSFPQRMISDNGTNFVSSAKTLKAWEEDHAIRQTLHNRKCKWQFLPSRAPWMGGFYERLIGTTKRALTMVLGRAMVTEDELQTILCEIEAQINDRPITYVSNSVDDLQPLTPSHLMYGHRLDSVPVATLDREEENDPSVFSAELLTRRQKHMQKILEHFRTRFNKEYLTSLQHSGKDTKNIKNPAVGDVVQIQDDGPRVNWNLGRVSELHKGQDGYIRSVKLKTNTGTISRPIALLYPLEINGYPPIDDVSGDKSPQSNTRDCVTNHEPPEPGTESPGRRVPRAAAIAARRRITTQLQ